MRDVGDAAFERDVLGAAVPVVVDFWAPWCRPCERVTATLRELEREHPDLEFVRVNADESPVVAARHRILALPTVLVLNRGEERARVVGARGRDAYVAALTAVR